MRSYIFFMLSLIVFNACKKETGDLKISACFNYTPSEKIQVGDTIRFTCCENDSLTYLWDFGDGKFSNQKNPYHIYTDPDSFKAKLIVKKNDIMDSITKNIVVQNITGKIYDTISPLSYFPAFPGSYWVYSNGDTLKIEDNYEIFYYNKSNWQDRPIIDTVYIPKFKCNSIFSNGNPGENPYCYVYKYTISTVTYRLPFRTILSEDINTIFPTSEFFAGNAGYGKTIKKDTSILVNAIKFDNVLMVINYSWNQNIGNLPWSTREYYAKNVGLIKRENRSILDTTKINLEFELISYKINK